LPPWLPLLSFEIKCIIYVLDELQYCLTAICENLALLSYFNNKLNQISCTAAFQIYPFVLFYSYIGKERSDHWKSHEHKDKPIFSSLQSTNPLKTLPKIHAKDFRWNKRVSCCISSIKEMSND